MANIIQIARYQLTDADPFGFFSDGDVLDVYLDTDQIAADPVGITTGITVERNGVSYTDASSYLYLQYGEYISVSFYVSSTTPSFCLGTKGVIVFPRDTWPFAAYRTEDGSPMCAVTPVACDLIIVGFPEFTQPSGETVADATLTVTATSTQPIQYKLGSDFVYGNGQASGTFTGLLQGTYRVYVRDQNNCKANVLVRITYEPVYGTFYTYEYKDVHGNTTVVDIDKKNYVGAETEILGGDNALVLSLRGEGETNKFAPVLSTQADLNIVSETDQYFIQLYTNDRDLFRVNYYKEGVLKWRGKLLPFRYLEDYKSAPYYVTITATDGLAELSEKYLLNADGAVFQGTVKLISLIAYCLQKTNVYLPIRVGINIYADDMAQTASDDPLDQAYCDYEAFYIAEKQPTLAFVLENILKVFKARIIQWDGYWNIVRVEELGTTYAYRQYDRYGDYVSNSTFNPVKDINYPDTDGYMFTSFPTLELQPGYGQIKSTYKLGLTDNIIKNGNFSLRLSFYSWLGQTGYSAEINKDGFVVANGGYALSEGYEYVNPTNVAYYMSAGEDVLNNSLAGTAYIQSDNYFVSMSANNTLKIVVRFKVKVASVLFGGTVYKAEVPYIKVRIRVKYGSLYLQTDGTWTSTESTIDIFVTAFNEYIEAELTALQPVSGTPTTGMDFNIRIYHAYAYFAQFQSVASLQAFSTYSGGASVLPTGYNTELRDDFVGTSKIYYYQLQENTSAAATYPIIRPTDYHVTNNPRQWILQKTVDVGTVTGANIFTFFIDYIKCTFLDNGEEVTGEQIKQVAAEPNNTSVFEEELILGSGSNIVETQTNFSIDLGYWFPEGGLTITTVNNLSFELLYKGWLRSSADANYELWARDGADESAKLHDINLKVLSNQYSASWRLLRGSVTNRMEQFSPLNSLREVNDSNRIYIPISMTIDDRACTYSGEFLELLGGANAVTAGSAFTTGFNIGYN